MSYQATIKYIATRSFQYDTRKKYKRDAEFVFKGYPNDEKLISSGFLKEEITYLCSKCAKPFTSITELVDHEKSCGKE